MASALARSFRRADLLTRSFRRFCYTDSAVRRPLLPKEPFHVISESMSRMDGRCLSVTYSLPKWCWSGFEEVVDGGLHFTLDLHGLAEEDVEVSVVEEDAEDVEMSLQTECLMIKERKDKKEKDDDEGRWWRIDLPTDMNARDAKISIKNGAVEIFVPKIKEEEKIRVM